MIAYEEMNCGKDSRRIYFSFSYRFVPVRVEKWFEAVLCKAQVQLRQHFPSTKLNINLKITENEKQEGLTMKVVFVCWWLTSGQKCRNCVLRRHTPHHPLQKNSSHSNLFKSRSLILSLSPVFQDKVETKIKNMIMLRIWGWEGLPHESWPCSECKEGKASWQIWTWPQDALSPSH